MRHLRSPSQPMSDPQSGVVTPDQPVEHLPLAGSMAEICCTIIEKLEQLVSHIMPLISLALTTSLSVLNEAVIVGLGFVKFV